MPDLEQSIAEWRRQMLAAGIKTPVPLEELEIHLRENIEQQLRSGMNEQQAFEVAVQQIGKVNMLKNEFAKVEEAKKARNDQLQEIIFVVITTLSPLVFGSMALFKIGIFSEMTSSQQMSWLAAFVTFSLLVWSGRSSCRILPVIRDKRIKGLIAYSGFVTYLLWICIFFFLINPTLGFTTNQWRMILPWACETPMGAFVGLLWGLEIASRKSIATSDQYA